MGLWLDAIRLVGVVNVVLLVVLAIIWGRNYLELRSKHSLALLAFATFLILENAMSIYMFQIDPHVAGWMTHRNAPPMAVQGMAALQVLEALGLAILTWSAWD